MRALTFAICVLVLTSICISSKTYLYKRDELVKIYANKIGPINNPSEVYPMIGDHSLFCSPRTVEHKSQHLGENLNGDRKTTSAYIAHYLADNHKVEACTLHYNSADQGVLKGYIDDNYYFQLDVEDIQMKGRIGYKSKGKYYIYNHIDINFEYKPADQNSGYVMYCNMSFPYPGVELSGDDEVVFTYDVKWSRTDIAWSERFAYLAKMLGKNSDAELTVHWLSILNSVSLVFLLVGVVYIIVTKTLNRDYSLYQDDDNDFGWKVISRDVFRPPKKLSLLSSLIGVGVQFIVMTMFILFLSIVGLYYPGNEGSIFVSIIFLYAITCIVAGFTANYFHLAMDGKKWAWNIVLTVFVFVGPFMVISFICNTVAAIHQSATALPFGTIILILVIWVFGAFPLTVLGGIMGKRFYKPFDPPIKPKNFPSQIPALPWHTRLPSMMALSGCLPFVSIYIELNYLFAAIWTFGTYQFWGILVIVFIILVLVTACISIACTYLQLSTENYHWWWNSFLFGSATGIYIFIYAVYYYFQKTQMTGFFQATFYFGYTFVVCYFFAIMLGTISFLASFPFVLSIYKRIHHD